MRRAAFVTLPCALAACAHQAAEVPERGLWIGRIQACRDTVESATVGQDYAGFPNLTIGLKPEWHALLRRETERLIDQPMPVRLDGRIVFEPIVRQPISGGTLSLSGASQDFERIRAAAQEEC